MAGTGIMSDVAVIDDAGFLQPRSILSYIPLVVERVLTFLPIRDINRVARVCQLWADVAKRVKRKRQQLDWLFWMRTDRNCSSTEMLISVLEDYISNGLNEIGCEPTVALTFVSVSYSDNISQWSSFAFNDFHRKLQSRMPKNCSMVVTWSSGMVGVQNKNNVEIEYKDGFSCLLLPKMTGVDIRVFDVKLTKPVGTNLPLETCFPDHVLTDDIKALLLFSNDVVQVQDTAFIINRLMHRKQFNLAVGGGFVEDLCWAMKDESFSCNERQMMGIAFCGNNVRAASIVMKKKVHTLKELDETMLRLKSHGLSEKHSAGFMFSCVGRGKRHWKKRNVEASAFSKAFPHTPLFGFFGNGEIGINWPPKATGNNSGENVEQITVHSYSTVIVLVSFS